MAIQKFTAEQVVAVLKATHGMIYLAAESLGCHPETIHNYARRYKSVQAEIDFQRERILDVAEQKLYQAIEDGNEGMIKYMLSNRGKGRGYVPAQEVTGKDGGPIAHKVDHAIDGQTAVTIFDILAAAGALPAGADGAQDDGIHPA